MSNSPEQLKKHWNAIHTGAGEAIRWVNNVRPDAQRLDNEADDLILSLRRVRNTARRLGEVSATPMTVGFFGLSQAGKSYLISTLAAGTNGKLETAVGGQRLDFITHINPPGGGKEATGLVTRFSRTAKAGPDDFPLELKLFAEVEVAKVLANSFFNDFNTERVLYRIDETAITQLLKGLSQKRQLKPVPGVSEDDVVALWDYLQDSFPASLRGLASYYWPQAVELAPWLSIEDRSQLFGIFWGQIPELSEAYLSFAKTLSRLGNATRVYAPLEALVRQTDRGLSQADSIMNVDMLERLGKDSDLPINVRPYRDGELLAPVSLTLAQLAALTVELVFPLVEPTRETLFEKVDLLDFPGYRGRLSVESLDDVRRAVESDTASPVAQLILRGKVAYLFEHYTDSQEMNVLVLCTPCNEQSNVNAVGPVLERWINKTQGATPEERALRKPGLLWAITKLDIRLGGDLDKAEDLLRIGWGGMMKSAMLERFGQYTWLQEWTAGAAFNNTFLVRKPRAKTTFLELEKSEELAISSSAKGPLELMRRTFLEESNVQRHIGQAEQAWDAMLALNDGGMARISEYLREAATLEVKLRRIDEQLAAALHQLDHRLGHWYQAEGASELDKKRHIAKQISDSIWPRRALLGELLAKMQLPDDLLRGLYLRADEDEPAALSSTTNDAPTTIGNALNLGDSLGDDDGFDLFGDAPAPSTTASSHSHSRSNASDSRFAQAVLREWIGHLRHLPEDACLMTYLGFDKAAVEALVDELITASSRLKLQERLLSAIASTEQIGSKREQLVGRQVLMANTVLGDFIGWLGLINVALDKRPNSRLVPANKLFQGPVLIAEGELPKLAPQPLDHTRIYVADWLVALSKIAEDNAGHSAGREISPEQNEALGKVLATLHGERMESVC